MLQLIHVAATVPAVVAACCSFAGRTARGASAVAAVLMLISMLAATVHPEPMSFAAGAVALWAAALCGGVAVRRTAAGTPEHAMAWHRVGGAVAMATVMLTMALRHGAHTAGASTSVHAHGAGSLLLQGDSWLLALSAIAVTVFAAQSTHALTRMRRPDPVARGAHTGAIRVLDIAEITSMVAMLLLMTVALLL